MQKLLLVYYYSENRATSQIWKILPNNCFPPYLGAKNGGVLSMRIQVILDSSFARAGSAPFSSPEPTILLARGRNRELWEQPFQACAIDADCVRPDGQNSVISFVISKWLLPELLFSDRWSRGMRLWERDLEETKQAMHWSDACLWWNHSSPNPSRQAVLKLHVDVTKQFVQAWPWTDNCCCSCNFAGGYCESSVWMR